MKNEILSRLEGHYKGAKPALNFKNAFELLVATILSAQCTDVRVNKVTETLFPKYPDAKTLAAADFSELAEIVHPCGCYQVKTKNLIATANRIMEFTPEGTLIDKITTYDEYLAADEAARKRQVFTITESQEEDD